MYLTSKRTSPKQKCHVYFITGNPQSLKQQPLTYVRQVLSLVLSPPLLEQHPDLVRCGWGWVVLTARNAGTHKDAHGYLHTRTQFPLDVVARARAYLAAQPMGAYTNSQVWSGYVCTCL